MEDKTMELLEEMHKNNKKNLMYQRLSTVLMLIFVAAVLFLLPNIISTLNTAKATLTHMNDAITEMEEALESVSVLAEEGELAMDGMNSALEKVNEFDIETLNEAIQDLSDVVEPMANFFGKFSR